MSRYIDLNQVEFLKVDGNKEFNHGVDCCINILLKQERVQAIPLDKVKRAKEEIEHLEIQIRSYHNDAPMISQADVLSILDRLIESEE